MACPPRFSSILLVLGCYSCVLTASADEPGAPLSNVVALAAVIQPIREKYHLPALGGAIVDLSGLQTVAVVGIRKRGDAKLATVNDLWHLGSDTKAMTATMIAALVEQGKISWDTKLGEVFPVLKLSPEKQQITLLQLLSHHAGVPANADWHELSRLGTLAQQRQASVAALASAELLSTPGTQFSYSNWGYVIAGTMAEHVTGQSYEELMHALVFKPLEMSTAGYGAPGKRGAVNEPWGHTADGQPLQEDNPRVMTAAGCVHCSLEDWGKFIADQLRGSNGQPALLKPESYTRLHTAPFGGDYALGWGVHRRPWAGGEFLAHSGSNTMNMAVVWMAPHRNFAVLAVCNQGDQAKACDDVCGALIALQQKQTSVH